MSMSKARIARWIKWYISLIVLIIVVTLLKSQSKLITRSIRDLDGDSLFRFDHLVAVDCVLVAIVDLLVIVSCKTALAFL